MQKRLTTQRITRLAFFVALALIFSLLESLLPPLISFAPGAKMGLSNVITLVAIVILGSVDASIIQILRCTLGSIITGNMSGLMYSLPAGIASLLIMIILYKLAFPFVSLMGISFVGAVFNNLAQVTVASLVLKTNMFAFLPVYIFASILAGLFVGIVAYFCIKHIPSKFYIHTAGTG